TAGSATARTSSPAWTTRGASRSASPSRSPRSRRWRGSAGIAFDHRERRSGVPPRLSRLGLALEPRDLGSADYVLSPRLAIVRKTEEALAPWVALGRFERGLEDVRDHHPTVIVVLQRASGAVPD